MRRLSSPINHDEDNLSGRCDVSSLVMGRSEAFPLPIPCQVNSARRVTTQSTFGVGFSQYDNFNYSRNNCELQTPQWHPHLDKRLLTVWTIPVKTGKSKEQLHLGISLFCSVLRFIEFVALWSYWKIHYNAQVNKTYRCSFPQNYQGSLLHTVSKQRFFLSV